MEKLHLPIIIELDEALENIKEVIQMCLKETDVKEINKFIGFRELEIVKNA